MEEKNKTTRPMFLASKKKRTINSYKWQSAAEIKSQIKTKTPINNNEILLMRLTKKIDNLVYQKLHSGRLVVE